MPKIFYTGDEGSQQAVGATLYNGNMKLYAVRRDEPLNMVFLGGHRISDALTYNITEGTMVPQYVSEDGENTVLDVYVSDDKVKSITFNLDLPNQAIPAAMRILQQQRSCTWDLLIVPEDCGSGCNQVFWVGRNFRLGSFQITSGITGFDDTKSAFTRVSAGKVTGQLLQYNGLTTKTLTPAATALHDVHICEELCADCGCPYQDAYRAGTAGLIEVTADGGQSWTALDTTAIVNGTEITSLTKCNSRLIAAHSDVNDAAGTIGGVAYEVAGVMVEATMTDTLGAAATPEIQAVIATGGSTVYALGSDGAGAAVIYKSCDCGLTFNQVVQTTITNPILSADYDSSTGNLWIGTTLGGVWAWDFASFTDESANILVAAPTFAAGDVISIEVHAQDSVSAGSSLGLFVENFAYESGNAWVLSESFPSAVFASAGDKFNYRTLIGSGTDLNIRDGNNYQVTEDLATLVGNITAISEGKNLLDEGTNYFMLVTDTGETVLLTQCGICFDAC